MASGPENSAESGNEPETIHLDLRTILPIVALGGVILSIIFLELCGREDIKPLASAPPAVSTATPQTPVATETAGPTPTGAAATATAGAQPGAGQRDVTRQQDLAAIAVALAQFHDENGAYPATEGNIQTLCAFEEFDKGCALSETLDPLPIDPVGDPGTNGYWYESDGNTYTVWAQRETEQFDECPNHPDFLSDFDSLMCVTGP